MSAATSSTKKLPSAPSTPSSGSSGGAREAKTNETKELMAEIVLKGAEFAHERVLDCYLRIGSSTNGAPITQAKWLIKSAVVKKSNTPRFDQTLTVKFDWYVAASEKDQQPTMLWIQVYEKGTLSDTLLGESTGIVVKLYQPKQAMTIKFRDRKRPERELCDLSLEISDVYPMGGERRAVRDAKENARLKAIDSRSIYTGGHVTTLALLNNSGAPRKDVVSTPGLRGMAIDENGTFYIASSIGHTIHRVTPDGDISVIAGLAGQAGSTDETGTRARFKQPLDVVLAPNGHLFISDFGSHRIRRVTPDGAVTTIAGNGSISDNPKDGRSVSVPVGAYAMTLGPDGYLYWTESLELTGSIRCMSPAGDVTTLYRGDRYMREAGGIVVDQARNIYFTQPSANRICVLSNGTMRVLTGGEPAGFVDGKLADAKFNRPEGLAMDTQGNLYVADVENHRIRRISLANGQVTTVAGSVYVGEKDGVAGAARFTRPQALVFDRHGLLWVTYHNALRRIVIPIEFTGGPAFKTPQLASAAAAALTASTGYGPTVANLLATPGAVTAAVEQKLERKLAAAYQAAPMAVPTHGHHTNGPNGTPPQSMTPNTPIQSTPSPNLMSPSTSMMETINSGSHNSNASSGSASKHNLVTAPPSPSQPSHPATPTLVLGNNGNQSSGTPQSGTPQSGTPQSGTPPTPGISALASASAGSTPPSGDDGPIHSRGNGSGELTSSGGAAAINVNLPVTGITGGTTPPSPTLMRMGSANTPGGSSPSQPHMVPGGRTPPDPSNPVTVSWRRKPKRSTPGPSPSPSIDGLADLRGSPTPVGYVPSSRGSGSAGMIAPSALALSTSSSGGGTTASSRAIVMPSLSSSNNGTPEATTPTTPTTNGSFPATSDTTATSTISIVPYVEQSVTISSPSTPTEAVIVPASSPVAAVAITATESVSASVVTSESTTGSDANVITTQSVSESVSVTVPATVSVTPTTPTPPVVSALTAALMESKSSTSNQTKSNSNSSHTRNSSMEPTPELVRASTGNTFEMPYVVGTPTSPMSPSRLLSPLSPNSAATAYTAPPPSLALGDRATSGGSVMFHPRRSIRPIFTNQASMSGPGTPNVGSPVISPMAAAGSPPPPSSPLSSPPQ